MAHRSPKSFPRGLLISLFIGVCVIACHDRTTPDERREPTPSVPTHLESPQAEAFTNVQAAVSESMQRGNIPGVATAIVKEGRTVWAEAFGFADLESNLTMTNDTVLNVASVSKTFVNAAVLRLVDQGRLDLDQPIRSFSQLDLEHPAYPDASMTARQLLTHTSSIADGPAYSASYSCGDPFVSLRDWIEGYLEANGRFYSAEQNFHEWPPGTQYAYSNVGFGLLAYLVEEISGEDFREFTKTEIFAPLGMESSGWHLSEIDTSRHATPYTYLRQGSKREYQLLARRGFGLAEESGPAPLCLYSFPNYPDGLVRTSSSDLARFLLAHLPMTHHSTSDQLLSTDSYEATFSHQTDRHRLGTGEVQGLTWVGRVRPQIGMVWGHSGSDPGVASHMYFSPESNVGVIVLVNANAGIAPITRALFELAAFL